MTVLEDFVLANQLLSYLIVFGGMFIEGEVFFLTASIFVSQGYLDFWTLILVTLLGVILGDIVWYYLGRFSKDSWPGIWLAKKFPRYHEWIEQNFISRYWRMAFFSKFLYYVNRLTPLIAGWHKMEFRKFMKIHLAAGVLWVAGMVIISYFLGFIIEAIGVKAVLRRIEWVLIGLGIIFIGGEYLLKILFSKRIKP